MPYRTMKTEQGQRKPVAEKSATSLAWRSSGVQGSNPGLPLFLQPKLASSQPGDLYEQEVDRVAEQVMRMPASARLSIDPNSARAWSLQRECVTCEDEKELQLKFVSRVADLETVRVMRDADAEPAGAAVHDSNGMATGAEAAVKRAASCNGAPLPTHIQRQFEGSLGADLSSVRVHTGSESAQAAQAVGAKAYTIGQDIHFAEGRYQPEDPFGMHLLAHEVAHTVQQSGSAQRQQHKLEVSTPQDAAEHEADRAADAMVDGRAASVAGITSGVCLRQPVSRSGALELHKLINAAANRGDLDEIRDLMYAIEDAQDDMDSRLVICGNQEYELSLLEAEEIFELVHALEPELMGQTLASLGQSLDSRVTATLESKDYRDAWVLAAAIDSAVTFYTARGQLEGDWLLQVRDEEIRTDRATALAARRQLEPLLPKSIDSMIPAGVDVESLNAGFHIAGNRKIAEGLETDAGGTRVWIGLTRNQLSVRFTPALKTNYHGIPTADVSGIRLIFRTGAIGVDAEGVTAESAGDEIRTAVTKLLAGSGFEQAGYDPYADEWLQARFDYLKTSVSADGGSADPDQVSANDITGAYVGAQVTLVQGVSQLDKNQTGLVIAPGTKLTIGVTSGGSVAKGDLMKFGKATVSTSGATIVSEGDPVIELKKVTLEPDGKVTLADFKLLGKATSAAAGESLLYMMVGAAQLSQGGVPDEAAMRIAAAKADPIFVPGLAKSQVEQKISAAIRAAVAANGTIDIDGKPLAQVLGL